MLIKYATHHRWSKPVTNTVMEGFSGKTQSKIRTSLKKAIRYNIQTQVTPVVQEFLDWFIPMYESRISSKDNPNVIPIVERIKNNSNQYYTLTLTEGTKRLGATIFSLKKESFSIAWRTYENKWVSAPLSVNPSMYMEYICEELATRYGCTSLVHGKDKNPYGLNSSIGLAAFKFSVGSQPGKAKEYDLLTIDTDALETDALIFEYPGEDQQNIKKAYLVTSQETESKWEQVKKYPHILEVETIYRD